MENKGLMLLNFERKLGKIRDEFKDLDDMFFKLKFSLEQEKEAKATASRIDGFSETTDKYFNKVLMYFEKQDPKNVELEKILHSLNTPRLAFGDISEYLFKNHEKHKLKMVMGSDKPSKTIYEFKKGGNE